MALHKDFPQSPHAILDPGIRWFPADESLRESSMEKLMQPLVSMLRKKVKEFRYSGYAGAADTSLERQSAWPTCGCMPTWASGLPARNTAPIQTSTSEL
jgi:type III restriction enzyme